jgi:hypothetical protein
MCIFCMSNYYLCEYFIKNIDDKKIEESNG